MPRDLPAGLDPAELEATPGAGSRRGRLRRRVRYLRRVREVLLRDLGGFSYEVHRSGGARAQEGSQALIEAKTERLTAIDAELRRLEGELSEPHAESVIREPGIGGTCPACGELHGSEAAYCSACGTPLSERAQRRRREIIEHAARQRIAALSAPPEPPAPAPVPTPVGLEPVAAAPESAADAPEPADAAPEPAAATPEPAAAADEPATAADEPSTADAPEPATATPEPATAADEQPTAVVRPS